MKQQVAGLVLLWLAGSQAGAGTLPLLGTQAKISMRDAAVVVQITRPTDGQEVRADVTCHFRMECREAKAVETPFTMAFPIGYDEDPLAPVMSAATCVAFSAQVDGNQPRPERRRWEVVGADGTITHYFGYVWGTRMRRHRTAAITVKYSCLLPVINGRSAFTYIRRSAASWYGPLQHETVRVEPRSDLRIKPFGNRQFACRLEGGNALWEVRNSVPHEDVHVLIDLPQQVQSKTAARPPRSAGRAMRNR
jgi:hypothetical protein